MKSHLQNRIADLESRAQSANESAEAAMRVAENLSVMAAGHTAMQGIRDGDNLSPTETAWVEALTRNLARVMSQCYAGAVISLGEESADKVIETTLAGLLASHVAIAEAQAAAALDRARRTAASAGVVVEIHQTVAVVFEEV